MVPPDSGLSRALFQTLHSAEIPANDRALIYRFVHKSLAREDLAKYMLDRISRGSSSQSLEETVLSIKQDLMSLALKVSSCDDKVPQDLEDAVRLREKHRCCVSGDRENLQAVYVVPPSTFDDDALRPGGYLRPLLEVSLTPKILSQLELFLQPKSREVELQNLWLMSPSIQAAYQSGHFQIRRGFRVGSFDFYDEETRLKPRVEWNVEMTEPRDPMLDTTNFNPSTPDPDKLPLPKRAILRVQHILAFPLHSLAVERQIQQGWPPVKQDTNLGSVGRILLRSILGILPARIRITLYEYIIGENATKALPFGLCLKAARPQTVQNEANALRMVEKYTTVPAPRLVDSVKRDKTAFILMTLAWGDRLDQVNYRMTNEERKQLGRDLGECICQWRRIPNVSYYQVANTLGGPAFDHRFEGKQCGPFHSNSEFFNYLTEYLEDCRGERPLSVLYEKKHKTYFTHSDLHRTNIVVQAGRLSCILDWEHAGFRPGYWEYTKALWPWMAHPDDKYIFSETFEDDYREELQAEEFLWVNKPVF